MKRIKTEKDTIQNMPYKEFKKMTEKIFSVCDIPKPDHIIEKDGILYFYDKNNKLIAMRGNPSKPRAGSILDAISKYKET